MIELMKLAKLLAPAVMQLVATGSASQLKETRQEPYRLLADDVDDDDDDAK